jgi:hypothetical protein
MNIDLNTLRKDISNEVAETFVKEYPLIQTWLEDKAENTRPKYVRHLIRYTEVLYENKLIDSCDPEGLLGLARKSTEEQKYHVQTLIAFQKACDKVLPDEKRAIIYQISITVKSFYNQFGHTFPRFKGSYAYSPQEKTKIPRLENVQTYIDSVKSLRSKMIIALESSTAIRMGSLLRLRWLHFKEVLEGQKIPSLRLKDSELKGGGADRYKGTRQLCFLTPLAKDFIMRYKVWYEKVTGKTISLTDPQSLELPFLITDKGTKLTYSGLNTSFEVAKKMGYDFRLHPWRTFMNEALMKVGVSKEHRDIFIAHKQPKVEKAYSIDLEMKNEFERAIKYLDFTYHEDENLKIIKGNAKELLNKDITDEEAKTLLKGLMIKFFGSG